MRILPKFLVDGKSDGADGVMHRVLLLASMMGGSAGVSIAHLMPGHDEVNQTVLIVATSLVCASVAGWLVLSIFSAMDQRYQEQLFQVRELIKFDPLTGALNRSYFLDSLRSSGRDGFLLIVDADHFKAINDNHGHVTGDVALIHLVLVIKETLGSDGILGRLGGEEFAVFLPGAKVTAAEAIAERLRAGVEQSPLRTGDMSLRMTVSVGAASVRRGETIGSALERADANLYAAKSAGRNCARFDANPAHALQDRVREITAESPRRQDAA